MCLTNDGSSTPERPHSGTEKGLPWARAAAASASSPFQGAESPALSS